MRRSEDVVIPDVIDIVQLVVTTGYFLEVSYSSVESGYLQARKYKI